MLRSFSAHCCPDRRVHANGFCVSRSCPQILEMACSVTGKREKRKVRLLDRVSPPGCEDVADVSSTPSRFLRSPSQTGYDELHLGQRHGLSGRSSRSHLHGTWGRREGRHVSSCAPLRSLSFSVRQSSCFGTSPPSSAEGRRSRPRYARARSRSGRRRRRCRARPQSPRAAHTAGARARGSAAGSSRGR